MTGAVGWSIGCRPVRVVGLLGSVRVQLGKLAGGHLQRVGRLGGRADHQPERFVFGVVEDLAYAAGLDEHGGEREGQQFVLDPDSATALQDDVELVLDSVTVAGRGLPRC